MNELKQVVSHRFQFSLLNFHPTLGELYSNCVSVVIFDVATANMKRIKIKLSLVLKARLKNVHFDLNTRLEQQQEKIGETCFKLIFRSIRFQDSKNDLNIDCCE